VSTAVFVDRALGESDVYANRRSGRFLIAVASFGLVLGGGVLGLTTQPNLEAGSAGREANYWQAVVAYHEAKYWAGVTPTERNANYWQAVVAYHEAKYLAQATSVDRDIAYWRAVVDYYETKYGAHAAPVKATPVKRDGPGGSLALVN
jgi:hypothetical protein